MRSNSKQNDKYDWMASSCAPISYPAEIVKGDFYLADGTSLYIPTGGRLLKAGWHDDGATHVVGSDLKALPTELEVKWMSYVEKKFYAGRFKLDYDVIHKYFKKGFLDQHKKQYTFRKIVAGVAPGGIVVVWLDGFGIRVEIGRYKAKEIELSIKEFKPNAVIPLNDYLNQKIERHLTEEVKEEMVTQKIPFGLWDIYRKKYNWQPKIIFANEGKVTLISFKYYNGEISTHTSHPEEVGYNDKAIPKYIELQWEDKKGNKFGSKIKLGQIYKKDDFLAFKKTEKEIFDIFKTASNTETKQTDLIIKIDKYNSNIKLFLSNEKEEFEITKAIIKVYENS